MDFSKMMTGFYMHSVCLPEEVTEQFNNLAGQLLELRCPGRGTWSVGLVRMGEKLVLQPGWSKFAGTNNVWQNDHLHFKSVCGTAFEVRIFDPCGMEIICDDDIEGESNGVEVKEETKKRSLSEENDSVRPVQRSKSNEVGVKETMPCDNPRKRSSPGKNNDPVYSNKRIKVSECCVTCREDEVPDSKEEHTVLPSQNNEEFLRIDNTNEDSFVQYKYNALDKNQIKEEQNNGLPLPEQNSLLGRNLGLILENCRSETAIPDYDVLADNIYGLLVRQIMSAEQKARVNNLAHRIQGNNPAFVCLLHQACSTRNSCVSVPREFLARHLQDVKQKILLSLPESEHTWSVDYYCIGRRIRGTSWVKFVKENNLRKGDMCMFELVSTADQKTFVVHVSRADREFLTIAP